MNRAFIFDLDGVVVDSEPAWQLIENRHFPEMFGKEISDKMPNLVGAGVESVIRLATSLGATVDRNYINRRFDEIAREVYEISPITTDIEKCVTKLIALKFRIGLVSQSPKGWIDNILPRLSFKDSISIVISIPDFPKLKLKPAPDGFLEALRVLGSSPVNSFVLEDSNLGIEAGKAAGVFTIGYRGNLLPGYEQTGADAYADTMDDVIALVEKFTSQ